MDVDDEEHVVKIKKKASSVVVKKKASHKKVVIPRREPSEVIPKREIIFITPDKTTCADCTCFPKEDPYVKSKKLKPCLKSPLTLYEYAAAVVDRLLLPPAFQWGEEEVAHWMAEEVGLPEYKECVFNNMINGRRLLMLEDPSHLAAIGVRVFRHIQVIASAVHALYGSEFVQFSRSIGLPPRKPLTHCTWFKSRTGPTWGIRLNWSRTDVLRWMKIIMPKPLYLDHWDLVWYRKPEFPKVTIARVKTPERRLSYLPHYRPQKEICREILVPRKFCITPDLPKAQQLIWMEKPPSVVDEGPKAKVRKTTPTLKKDSRLVPKPVSCQGLSGSELLLARRKMARPKFFPKF